MNKKVVIAICAVVAFFLGCIWMDGVPAIGPLVAFLELLVGFAAGFFFTKDLMSQQISASQNTIQKLMEEVEYYKERSKKAISSQTPRTRRSKKVEEPKGE